MRIANTGLAMFLLVLVGWGLELALYSFTDNRHPGWIAESLGSGLVVALVASIAWFAQRQRPRNLIPAILVAVVVSGLLAFGRAM